MYDGITTFSLLKPKPSFEPLLLEQFLELIRVSRDEFGCLIFDLYRVSEESPLFVLHESWESREAWTQHSESFHLGRFKATVAPYLEDSIKTFEAEQVR